MPEKSSDSLRRAAEGLMNDALKDTPVVVVNGARQVGKSTLVRTLRYKGSVEFETFDNDSTREAARRDMRSFLRRSADTLVIDEAQLEPTVFRAIKAEVDRDRRPGRFVLTGSSRLMAAPDMADSLVGRVETLELWPLSQGEIEGNKEDFIHRMFEKPRTLLKSGTLSRADLLSKVCVGGFPEAWKRSPERRARWFGSYVTTTVEKVVREIAELERLSEIPRLLRLCAARTSTELNTAEVSNALGIPVRTGSAYLGRLNSAFLVQLIPAWSNNVSAKVVRKPKISIVDSGLAAHLMGVSPKSLFEGASALGPLLETFVTNELRRQCSALSAPPALFHFRDRSGKEVDLLLEHPDGRVVGVEVKATASPSRADFAGLHFLAERLGARFAYGVVLCLAPEATPWGRNMAALPLERLWRKVN